MSETPKGNETQTSEVKSLENNIKIDLENGKIDITADNKLTKSELTSIEKMLTVDKNEILGKTQEDLTKLKQVVVQDLKNRLERGKNPYISSLISRTENLLNGKIGASENTTQTEQKPEPQVETTQNLDGQTGENLTGDPTETSEVSQTEGIPETTQNTVETTVEDNQDSGNSTVNPETQQNKPDDGFRHIPQPRN